MFEFAKTNSIELTPEQVYAIWFHDAVYDPMSKTNEEDSADVFGKYVSTLKVFPYNMFKIRQIIWDTKKELPTIEESKIVIDLDLHRLADPEKVTADKYLIKDEFAPYMTEEEFILGRLNWVKEMLDGRKTIFVSDNSVFTKLEEKARSLLKIEVGMILPRERANIRIDKK